MELDKIREFFKNDIYAMETTGIEIVDVKENYAKTMLKVDARHKNADNTVMGGCIYTMADFTFAVAANAGNPITNTLSSNIVFNSAAKGEYLYAESSIVKNGRTIATYEVRITDENDRLIATSTSIGFRRS